MEMEIKLTLTKMSIKIIIIKKLYVTFNKN